jgi:hypothetical protein
LLRDDSLLLGLAALTAAVGFAWLWVRSLPAPNPDQLLEEIAVLDERYAADRISKASYAKRRATLKSQLRATLARRAKR